MNVKSKILQGVETAFIDRNVESVVNYRPQFVYNDFNEKRKVLCTIEKELSSCEAFIFSVAFITLQGITPLLQTLKELKSRNIKGQILTTDFLTFTEPRALDKIASLDNIELRIYKVGAAGEGFHTKCYMFSHGETKTIITGSSNLTESALTVNKEWNTKLVSCKDGEYLVQLQEEFKKLFNSTQALSYADYIDEYKLRYAEKKAWESKVQLGQPSPIAKVFVPNRMQEEFIANLKDIVGRGEKRALLISATATGKTYASAFAAKELKCKRMLFIVHRETIDRDALKTYRNVFGNSKTLGLLTGTSKEMDCDFVFATMQTMGQEKILKEFAPDTFDMIIIDEAHRAGANTYQKIMNYFKPKLFLGMTASPDRTDGFDIYKLFDHNIASNIRLQTALEENMVCPFHYYGIADLEVDGKFFEDKQVDRFKFLTSEERVRHVIENAEYYGFSGPRLKGLVFCSNVTEAEILSERFNEKGYRTTYLCGKNSQDEREDAIRRLSGNDIDDPLDYIFTVEIFNEGIDIPAVNQVIMLRETQSPIIFIQQLGRGLRKTKNEKKDFLIVLDFIGNYHNNYMIPLALSGDQSGKKEKARRQVTEGTRLIPGASTIHFDKISRARILRSIDDASFNSISTIKESYQLLKFKLAKIPTLIDFDKYDAIDPVLIFEHKALGSYHAFLKKYEKEYTIKMEEKHALFLNYLSMMFGSGKRRHELLAIQLLLSKTPALFEDLKKVINIDDLAYANIVNLLSGTFLQGTSSKTYKSCIFIKENGRGDYTVSQEFMELMKNSDFTKQIEELIAFGLYRNSKQYANVYKDTSFCLYETYTYRDVCRLLNWERGEVATNIGGYKHDKRTNTYPVFINYDKSAEIADSIKYEDQFINESLLQAISKSKRTLKSPDVQTALNATHKDVKMHLFVRKNKEDGDSKEFYYLGPITATGDAEEFVMTGTTCSAVKIFYKLAVPVRDDIYDFLTTSLEEENNETN